MLIRESTNLFSINTVKQEGVARMARSEDPSSSPPRAPKSPLFAEQLRMRQRGLQQKRPSKAQERKKAPQ